MNKNYLTISTRWLSLSKPQLTTKTIAVITALSILLQTIAPTASYALTGGPASPEFSKFESVSTDQMVDPFTGDFTYSLPLLEVPGPNGGGYPISLSYHSGSSPEEEASWVGYGLTLNPGAVTRSKQGYPDDANGDDAIFFNKIGTNWTINGGTEAYLKMFNIPGINISDFAESALNVSADLGLEWQLAYNNRIGLSMQYTPYLNASVACASAHVNVEDGEFRATAALDPGGWIAGMLSSAISLPNPIDNPGTPGYMGTISYYLKSAFSGAINSSIAKPFSQNPLLSMGSKSYTLYNYSAPTVLQDYEGYNINLRLGGWAYLTSVPVGYGGAYFGGATWQNPTNDGISQKPYYGYLHTASATSNEDALMDYTVEKQDMYNLRDNYLPIPHSGADMYNVVSEGVSGSFRAYSNTIGHFRPNKQHSATNMYSGSMEIGLGVTNTYTVALSLSQDVETTSETANDVLEAIVGGGHTLEVGSWYGVNGYEFPESLENDNYYFRMIGDLGGYSEYNNVYGKVVSAKLKGYYPDYVSHVESEVNNGELVSRATFIGYHTNVEMKKDYNRYSYRDDSDLATSFNRSNAPDNSIGEFAITNKAGTQYVYALPVYAEKEAELSVDVSRSGNIDKRTLVYKNITSYMNAVDGTISVFSDGVSSNDDDFNSITSDDIGASEKLVGTYRENSYATAHLLTQITQPNYIDVTNNGPTSDDIGGWTKFNYTKLTDSYHWRIPYNGLFYAPANLSDGKDDMGSFRFGDKEVYYLESIETATHIAKFETSDRADGIQAPDDFTDNAGSDGASPASKTALQKLNKITLYAKDADGNAGEIIKRIYFEYDYSCFPGIPNFDAALETDYSNIQSQYPDFTQTGKLTLKKVWMEYGEVSNASISPYEFGYIYPTADYPTKIKYEKQDTDNDSDVDDDDSWQPTTTDEYDALDKYGEDNNLNEQPQYTAYCSDRWGYYRAKGAELANEMFAWVDQTPDVDFDGNGITTAKFDPAAWQLKQIKLPTAAEIHVLYEQDDYSYVQNRKAMAMIPLNKTLNVNEESGRSGYKIYMDVSSIGIEGDEEAIEDMKDWIQKQLVDPSKKAYFNFLYSMNTDAAGLDNCNSAYVSGFVNVYETGIDENGLYVKLGKDAGTSGWEFPYDACIEMYKTTNGNLNYAFSCDDEESLIDFSTFTDKNGNADAVSIGEGIYELADHLVNSVTGNYESVCTKINLAHSYIRLPVPDEKKGGGLRVKYLLTYDRGLERNDAMVYGHEYNYIGYDGLSSGVASNEPIEGGEENALITYLPKREESSTAQVLASGEDKSQFTGPIGSSILPGPSVGYSRVVVRNIHSAYTHDGINVFEYYTTNDYPFDGTYSYTTSDGEKKEYKGVAFSDLSLKQEENNTYAVIYTEKELEAYALQGYKFVLNGMNGQLKKQTQYSGKWDDYNNPGSLQEVSSIRYNYNEPGEPVKALNAEGTSSVFIPGKASEIIAESKKIADETGTSTLSLEFGFGAVPFPPFEIPYIIPIAFKVSDQTHIYTHITTQTDYYPPIVKSITKYQDGTYSTVNNLYYDELSGEPIVTSAAGIHDKMKYSANGTTELTQNGTYFSYNQPGTFYYDGMGQKAGSEGFCFDTEEEAYQSILFKRESSAVIVDGETSYSHKLEISGTTTGYLDVLNKFFVGDLLAIQYGSNDPEICNVTAISGSTLSLKGAEGFGFVDASAGSWNPTKVSILKSGRANLLLLNAGNVVSYGKEFDATATDNIISATASTFVSSHDVEESVEEAYGLDDKVNKVESGEAGKWFLDGSYVYKTDLSTNNISFKSGLFADFKYFNFDDPTSSSEKWICTGTPVMYAPDGNLLEEKNILDIYSTAKFGYGNTLPYLVASNAIYENVLFESFENERERSGQWVYFDAMKLNSAEHDISSDFAHSGAYSIKIGMEAESSGSLAVLTNYESTFDLLEEEKEFTEELENSGLVVKLWVKNESKNKLTLTLEDYTYLEAATFNDITFESVARTGEWELYQAVINPEDWNFSTSSGTAIDFNLQITFEIAYSSLSGTAPEIYIDDIRFQPLNAQMITYVYDPATFKLLTQFDDQHFGLYYQYNDEGKLIRKQKETERGLKTIVETQYNIPTTNRN